MAKALQPAIDLARNLAVRIELTVEYITPGLSVFGDTQILHGDQFGDGEAVVHLQHAELLARVIDTRLLVSGFGCQARIEHVAAVPLRCTRLLAAAG
ncbi:hypothetical protein D3C84_1154560 [compost metagenome]